MNDIFDDIVAGFYKAASGQWDWGKALKPLQQLTDAWLVQVQGIDCSQVAVTFSYEVGPCPPEAVFDYLRIWHRSDPRASLVMALGEGEWVNCHEHFDDAFVARNAFYQDFLIPYGGRYVSGTQLFRRDNEVVMLGVHRGRHSLPLSGDEITCCRRLARHLAEAMLLYRAQRARAPQVNLGAELVSRLRVPIVLIDELRYLHHANPTARALLATGDTLVERDGRLGCRSTGDELKLSMALRELALAGDSYISGRPHTDNERNAFLHIGRPLDKPLGLFLYTIRPQATMGSFGAQPLAMGIIHDPSARPELDPFVVAVSFDLTPAEARVAVALARGASVADIAAEHEVSAHTVRS